MNYCTPTKIQKMSETTFTVLESTAGMSAGSTPATSLDCDVHKSRIMEVNVTGFEKRGEQNLSYWYQIEAHNKKNRMKPLNQINISFSSKVILVGSCTCLYISYVTWKLYKPIIISIWYYARSAPFCQILSQISPQYSRGKNKVSVA